MRNMIAYLSESIGLNSHLIKVIDGVHEDLYSVGVPITLTLFSMSQKTLMEFWIQVNTVAHFDIIGLRVFYLN